MKKLFLQVFLVLVLLPSENVFSQDMKYRIIEKGEKKEVTKEYLQDVVLEDVNNEEKNQFPVVLRFDSDKKKKETVNETHDTQKPKAQFQKPSPIFPQLSAPPKGREPHDDAFFRKIIDRTLAQSSVLKTPVSGVDFYEFLESKLQQSYKAKEWTHVPFEEFCERMRLRFISMHQIFRFAYYNVQSYERIIAKASRDFGVPEYIIKSIIVQESQGKNDVQSWKGAKGLMQLMDMTGDMFGVEDPYDPVQNIRAGTRHFKGLLIQFEGDLSLAIAAYNAGGTRVQRYEGVPPYPETQNYVARVSDYIELYKQLYQ